MPVDLNPADREFLDGLVQMKLVWSTRLFPRVFDTFRDLVSREGGEPRTWQEVKSVLEPVPLYQLYAVLERELQRQKYAALVPAVKKKEGELMAELAAVPETGARVLLDPALPLPRYYTTVDFHQHPGGVWSDDIDGFVYEYATRSTNPTFRSNQEIFRQLAGSLGDRPARRILDMGCGFGKTTMPLARTFPGADVVGIDLAAPCLKLARLRAAQEGLAVTYAQQNAERTSFRDESFDLVTAQQLLHEIPRTALRNVLREAFRLLQPGGRFVALDFHSPGTPFGTFIHYGHARRNAEPFMPVFNETDVTAELVRAGFADATMEPFGEDLGLGASAPDGRPREWRFPWKRISACKPLE